MLEIKGIESGYGQSMIIHDFNLTAKQGEVIALMGRNGAGKTTLLKTIIGLIKVKNGTISYQGEDITSKNPEDRALSGIAYVPQGRDIFPFLTVHENLILGLEARGKNASDIPPDIYELFPELKTISNRKGGDLSGGQQQQLAIARMLITNPSMVLLDEPTEGIQPNIVSSIEHSIRLIKEQGKVTVLLVEQFIEFAIRLADTCYVMEKGSIVFGEKTADISKEMICEHLSL